MTARSEDEKALLLYVTAPDATTAEDIARGLVGERVAACVNIIPAMRSVYRWKGRIDAEDECVMIVKTTEEQASAARAAILERHPYETPCVLAVNIDREASGGAFLEWIIDSVR